VAGADAWVLLTADGRAFDYAAYHALHDTYRAPWLDKTMQFATKVGDTKTGLFGLIFFGFFGPVPVQATAKLCAVSLAGASILQGTIKWIVGRERPDFDRNRRNSSFPSGHATGAAAVAAIIAHRHRRLGWVAWAVAVLIGLSRIYLGRHFPSDVLSGGLLGALVAWLVIRGESWFQKLHF
jgi:undecaprenyl-diphosphatase